MNYIFKVTQLLSGSAGVGPDLLIPRTMNVTAWLDFLQRDSKSDPSLKPFAVMSIAFLHLVLFSYSFKNI